MLLNVRAFICALALTTVCVSTSRVMFAARSVTAAERAVVFGPQWGSVSLDSRWRVETNKSGYVLFHYADLPGAGSATVVATIAVFRLVVAPELRTLARSKIAAAYAIDDISGAKSALFGRNADLVMLGTGKKLDDGEHFKYVEPIDARRARARSTLFLRGSVFFPRGYSHDGVVFFVLGRQESATLEIRADALDKIEEIVAGIGN